MARRQRWLNDALERFESPLVRYANRLTGDLEAARDIAQDCFLRLCRQRPEQLDGHLGQWLFTVCRNRAFDHLRTKGRMDTLDTEVATHESPATRLEQREQAGQLLATIADLPHTQQEVLHLKFSEGLSYKRISAITGASVSSVGVLLHTALKTLRARLTSPARSPS